MRTKVLLATALAALAATGAALAGNGRAHGIHYAFLGQVAAAPAGGHLAVTVVGA